MKFFTILFISLNLNLYSQSNYPNYSTGMFSKDTANIAKFAIDLPLEKKAELYALAELWSIIDYSTRQDNPDTIYKKGYNTKKEQKKRFNELKKEFLLAKKHIYDFGFNRGWQVYYFFDINKDGKIDILNIERNSEDSIENGYPHVFDNHYTFYLSTQNKFYKKDYSAGRITSMTEIQNEYHFTRIGYNCCDQFGTYVCLFHIPIKRSELFYDCEFWGRFDPPIKNDRYNISANYYTIPENFIEPKYYVLCKDIKINVGNIGVEWNTFLTFKKNTVVRVFSEEKNFYFVELKVKKEMNVAISEDYIYVIIPYSKTEFETFAESFE
jgi:hypothetical protein